MMVAGGAYANIASQGYVDQQIDTRQVAGDYATNTELNSVRTTATSAQSAATAAKTAADDAQDAADAAAQCIREAEAVGFALYHSADDDPVKNYEEIFTENCPRSGVRMISVKLPRLSTFIFNG